MKNISMKKAAVDNVSAQDSSTIIAADSHPTFIRYVKLLLVSAVLGAGVLYTLDAFNHSMNPNTPPSSLGQHFQ
ncbi:hypothetical protein [Teredinibacter waterburyi]|uniref:hypothetical protein n=1 Tax=Teredinibacter waterburyi TaxID=1500538 RepID=UPI00165F64F5|nr:hypothetical protein [Teredinibacter waterburyi]